MVLDGHHMLGILIYIFPFPLATIYDYRVDRIISTLLLCMRKVQR